MTRSRSVFEKFLTESIQTASEEIREELEAIKEGSELSQSISIIEKILDDLLSSSGPCVDSHVFSSILEEAQNKIEEEIATKDVEFRYNIGEEVTFDGTVYRQNYQIEDFKRMFQIPDDVMVGKEAYEIQDETVLIIGRTPPVETSQNSYVVEYKGTMYFVDEDDLH